MERIRRYLGLSLLGLLLFGVNLTHETHVDAQAGGRFELGGQILGFLSPDEMRSAGMSWLKMQISYRRSDETRSIADAQNVIDHARRHGFKVLLSIKGLKNELNANPAQYYRNYAAFLGRVAARNPDAIEVWNEPNIDAEWPAGKINGGNYTQMLREAYPAIKAANPNVMVISGAPAPTGYFGGGCAANGCDDKIFIEQMRAAGAAQYFDCTGIHYNEGVLPPTASSGDPRGNPNHYTRYYPTMVSTYRTVFNNKPLCFTELGYLTPAGLGTLPPGTEWARNTTAQNQARWLAQAAQLSRDGGVVRLMIVWNVDASFTPSNPFAGWAIIRQNRQCLPCATLAEVMVGGPGSAPNLVAPAHQAVINNPSPQFRWDPVPEATGYEIQIDNNVNFSSPERTGSLSGTSFTPNPALPDGVWRWRVRALDSNGPTPWSSVRRVTIDTQPPSVPVLVAPQNGANISNAQPTLSWNSVSGTARYELRLGTANPPTTVIPVNSGTSYQPAGALAVGRYYWQVRALDAASNASAWSAPFSMNITSPANAAPQLNYYTQSTVRLRWGRVEWASSYQIQVDESPDFSAPLVYEATLGANTLEATTSPLTNGRYYWRVRARRANGSWGTWSATDSFSVRAP